MIRRGFWLAAGAVTVFSDTALTIAVRDVFAGARAMTANSWLESANQMGQIVGPAAAEPADLPDSGCATLQLSR